MTYMPYHVERATRPQARWSHRLVIPLVGLLVGGIALTACVRPAASPSRTPATTDAAAVRAHEAFARYAMYGLSGNLVMARNGTVVLEQGYGLANREQGTLARTDTKYDVGSITKTFTAAAVLRLVADGRVALDAPISRYLGPVPSDKAMVTVHHVLTHNAGFPLDPSHAGIEPSDGRDAFVRKALEAKLLHAPGAAYRYSNLGYGLLAVLVERVTGEAFREHVSRVLMVPAGLRHTGWWRDSVAIPRDATHAVGYQFSDRDESLSAEPALRRGAPDSPVWQKWPLGAAGIVMTVGDLHRWWEALAGGRILPPALTRRMLTADSATHGDQGYGWTIRALPGVERRISRGGARTGFTSFLAHYPDRAATVAYALNQSQDAEWQTVATRSVERAIAGAPDTLPPATVRLAAAELRHFVGIWTAGSATVHVTADSVGTLLVGAEGQAAVDALLRPGEVGGGPGDGANERSRALIVALASAATVDSAVTSAATSAALRAWLRDRVGRLPSAAVTALGTTPHPSGANRVQTFVRVGDSSGDVLRLIWDGPRLLAWADGARLPGTTRFRPSSATTAAAFSPRDPVVRELVLLDVAGRQVLRFRSTRGTSSAAFTRRP